MNWTDKIQVFREDCKEVMKRYPDNHFDWSFVDPPYGIGEDGLKNHSRDRLAKAKRYTPKNWDSSIPDSEYFKELKRVSKNQIIWGWNYFVCYLSDCPSYIVWDKDNTGDFADCESAWCSKKGAARIFKWRWNGMLQQNMKNKQIRIHPTEKPIALYKWLLENYANKGDKIFDSHFGSGSIAIACHDLKFDLVGCEIDQEYYDLSYKRFKEHAAQLQIF